FFPTPTITSGGGVAPAPFPVILPRRNNPLAVTGMVSGILSLTVGCCCYGLPFNILGIIFSLIALAQISRDPVNQQGRSLAMPGLVLSILSVMLAIFAIVLGAGSHWTDFWRRLQRL